MIHMDKYIQSIEVVKLYDCDSDLSWLVTEYDVEEDNDGNVTGLTIIKSCRYTDDDVRTHGAEKVLEWIRDDLHRLETHGDSWSMVGIRAIAHIVVGDTTETITSSGLWGIESDSETSHFNEVVKDEMAELKEILKTMDFSAEEIEEAASKMEMFYQHGKAGW